MNREDHDHELAVSAHAADRQARAAAVRALLELLGYTDLGRSEQVISAWGLVTEAVRDMALDAMPAMPLVDGRYVCPNCGTNDQLLWHEPGLWRQTNQVECVEGRVQVHFDGWDDVSEEGLMMWLDCLRCGQAMDPPWDRLDR